MLVYISDIQEFSDVRLSYRVAQKSDKFAQNKTPNNWEIL